MEKTDAKRGSGLTIAIAITVLLLLMIGGIFLLEVFSFSQEPTTETETVEEIEARAAALLAQGDATRGETLIETYQCAACHVIGAQNNIAPAFDGLADRAGEQKPPLSAAAYIYESIVSPSAYIVDGYQNSMAQNFKERVSEQELADLMAYLLTRTSSSTN